jgi:hypothetical protein
VKKRAGERNFFYYLINQICTYEKEEQYRIIGIGSAIHYALLAVAAAAGAPKSKEPEGASEKHDP